ncbi:MAG: penicillin-binding protein activator [Proteobacteria bacterium]|nr:penicillin-binding protein activator [Pseudomonadota bacterium]
MKNIILISVILLICACGNQSIRPDKSQYHGFNQAQSYYKNQEYDRAAASYTQLYNDYHEDEFAIYAADSWLQLGDYQQAGHYLSQVKKSNDSLFKLVQGELYVRSGKYDFKLDTISGQLRPRYLALKAKIYDHYNNHLEAALALIELSEINVHANVNHTIITHLLQVSESQLTTALFDVQLSTLQQGWLEAVYVSILQDSIAIKDWQDNWPNHPANQIFERTSSYANIAVLLPLTGKYKNISNSIQQGMIAALYGVGSKQQLAFFDTGSNGESFSYAWYGAIESGAEFIIGPLEKNSIAQLTQINSSNVPVLLLNQLEQASNPFGFFQFSLSKENDVANVASRLVAENKKRVIMLAPETDTGRKLAQHFNNEYSYLGGQVVNYAFYPVATHDYSREIKQALGLNDSKIRARNLQSIIGRKINNTPQIRPDFDAIFLIAKPKHARLLKPQLKFFQAESIPVFATSQIHSTSINTALDKDLNGVKFPQSAFTIDADSVQDRLNFDTTQIDSNKKFFAFGYDAITIFPRLEWMQKMQNQSIVGMSGKLTVDGNGMVHRTLDWAQYRQGRPVLLPALKSIVMNKETTQE